MGIALAAAQLLVEEHRRARFSGRALTLGRQDLALSIPSLARFARDRGVALRDAPTADDQGLFHALGFDALDALDASDFEGAAVVHDLNHPVPEALHGRYDLVFNGGTLEHVFNVPVALASVHALLKVGGRAVHLAPVSNLIDHGFYSFSPTLLYDYYSANGYAIPTAYVFQARSFEHPWTVYRYEPGALDAVASRFHDLRRSGLTLAGLWFCVEKTAASTSDVVPQQGHYRRAWADAGRPSPPPGGLALRLRDAKRRLDRELPLFNPRAMPPRVGRYG